MTKRKVKKIVLVTLNVLLIVGLSFTSGFFYIKYTNEKQNNLTTDQRITKYEAEISKTYTLPIGEKATLADVKSADDLKKDEANKDFFKDVIDGDIVLIYPDSKLGILYRPTAKKIIKTGPLAYKQQLTAQIVGAKADRDIVIALLKQAFSNDLTNATETDPKAPLTPGETIVVDVTGKNTELATKLAAELKGKVGKTPEDQEKPADGSAIAIYAAPPATTDL